MRQTLTMQSQCTRHPNGGTEHRVGHIRPVDVVQVEATHERQGLNSLDVAAAQGIDGEMLHGTIVIVDMVVVLRLHAHHAAHGKDHVQQRQPGPVETLAFEIVCTEATLIEQRNEDVDTFEVRVDQSLPFPRPWDPLTVLGRVIPLLPDGEVVCNLDRVEWRRELRPEGRLHLEHAHEGSFDRRGTKVGGLSVYRQ